MRGIFEMEQFLREGTINMCGEVIHFWKSSPTPDILVSFFDDDLTLKPIWKSMREFKEEYIIGDCRVATQGLVLEMDELARNYGFELLAKKIEGDKSHQQERLQQFNSEVEEANRRFRALRSGA